MKTNKLDRALWSVLVSTAMALVLSQSALACTRAVMSSLVGRWQYIQPPDHEGEVLDIAYSGGRFRGIMNGLERTGDHGLYYYVVELTNLAVAPDGNVSFTVGAHSFFIRRPALSRLDIGDKDNGSTREEMRFHGLLEGADLVLKCEGLPGSCPDSTLRFKRIPTPTPAGR
jgi:hypothetical protein